MSERAYPIQPEDGPRFTNGLMIDVAAVLTEHGYPPLDGLDYVELQQSLYRFLYGGAA